MTKYKNSLLSSSCLNRTIMVATLAGAMAVPLNAANAIDPNTTPSGGNVVGGQADISKPANNVLNVDQHTNRAVIDWQSFNIGENARAEFFQPGAGSLAVNRVVGGSGDPTKILGQLKANGRLMVLDQNGIFFGKNSVIDTNGIIASTGTVSTDQVMSGADKIELSNFGAGEIVMKGTVNVAEAGLAAFVAPTVKNYGVINARLGKVAFGAGSKVTVDLYGDQLIEIAVDDKTEKALLENTGQINAQGGSVALTANAAKGLVDNVINMEGVTRVSSVEQVGGKIVLKGGDTGNVRVAGELDASGKQGGGEIQVTGQNVHVTQTAEVKANAGQNGDGGTAFIYGEDFAVFEGLIQARGGIEGGNGGEAEISAGTSVGYYGTTDLSAPYGETGTLLIDPEHLTISDSSFSADWDFILSGGQVGTVNINDQALANTLHTSNVNLWATEAISTSSDIDISEYDYETVDTKGTWKWWKWETIEHNGITQNNVTLAAPTVNIDHDVTIGQGQFNANDLPGGESVLGFGIIDVPAGGIQVDTLNLNGKIYSRTNLSDLAYTTLAGDNQINTTAETINVLSNSALIQQGIHFAQDGATVNVGVGEYTEQVTVDRQIDLRGAQAGNDARGRTGNETIVKFDQPEFNDSVITVTENGAGSSIDGFTVEGFVTRNNNLRGTVRVEEGADNVTIQNNIITTDVNPTNVQTNMPFEIWVEGDDVTISQNSIERSENALNSSNNGNGTSNANTSIRLGGVNNADVVNNDISGGNIGISNGSGVLNVEGNSISNSVSDGVWATLAGTTLNVVDNTISDVDGDGVKVAGTVDGSTINIDRNDISAGNEGVLFTGQVKNSTISLTDNQITAGSDGVIFKDRIKNSTISITGTTPESATITSQDDGILFQKKASNSTISIDNLEIVSGADGDGIDVQHIRNSDFTVTNSDVTAGREGIEFDNVISGDSVVTVHNNQFDTQGHGLHFESQTDIKGEAQIIITENDIEADKDGILFESDISNVVPSGGSSISDEIYIGGNTIVGADNGISITGNVSKWRHDTKIENNTIEGEAGNAIQVTGNVTGSEIKILHNDNIKAGNNGIYLAGGEFAEQAGKENARFTIDKNRVRKAENGAGIYVADQTPGGLELDITRNSVWKTGTDGIFVDTTSNTTIDNNNVGYYGPGLTPVYSWSGAPVIGDEGIDANNSAGVQITNNNVTQTATNGISINPSPNANIIGNTITNAGENGIDVYNSDGAIITLNDIQNVDQNAILVKKSDDTMIASNVIDQALTGIHVLNSDDVDILSNEVSNIRGNNTRGDGVLLRNGKRALIAGNDIENVGDEGIFASGNIDGLEITGNTIVNTGLETNASGNGIEVLNARGSAEIIGNNITNADYQGIWVKNPKNNSSFVITGNTIDGALHNGILVDGNATDVIGNTVDKTGKDGIDVSDSAGVNINNNLVGTNGGAGNIGDEGIDVNNSNGAMITANLVMNTVGNGISVNPSDFAEIIGNEVFGAAGNGINVVGGQDIRIDNNNVAAVLGHGIFTDGAYGLSVVNNDVLGTGQDGIHIVNAYGPIEIEIPQERPGQGDDVSQSIVLDDIPFIPFGPGHHLTVDGNEVALTVGHGIYINGANTTDVTNNVVFATGLASISEGTPITIDISGPEGFEPGFNESPQQDPEPIGFTFEVGFNGDDIENETMTGNGIHVENVSFGDERPFEPADAGEEAPAFTERAALNITGNDVSYTGGHGIFAGNNRETFMEGNDVDHAGISSATVEFATGETGGDIDPLETIANKLRQILGYDSDGLSVTKTELEDLRLVLDTEGPFINDVTNELDEVEKSGLKTRILEYVTGTSPNSDKDGFHVQNIPTLVADNNVATNSGDDGFDADNISAPETLVLTNNLFVNNGGSGVEISNTPSTELRNNLLLNNGANGLFMQGANNGTVALIGNAIVDNPIGARFESGAIDLTDLAGFNTFDGGVTAMQLDNAGSPGDLTFVGNTLGNTIFSGQSGFYVQLQGGTLFQPGTPTIINGIGATYDGLRPLDLPVPGILTVAQLNAIEAKLFDFDDPGNRGQIFAGSLPGVDQENILANAIENFLGFGNNLTVTVTGFPTTIPGAGTQALTGGPITAAQAAGLEPAAGGDDDEENGSPAITYANCWAEVTSGGSYNLDFGSNPVSLMQAVTRCGQVVE